MPWVCAVDSRWDAAQKAPFLYAALKASANHRLDPCVRCVSEASRGCVQLTAEGGWDAARKPPSHMLFVCHV